PAAGTCPDPLARVSVSGLFLLQEYHDAGLLPRSWRGLRGRGTAALRAGAGVADARAVRRGHHAFTLRYRRRVFDLLNRLAEHVRPAGVLSARGRAVQRSIVSP